MNVETAKSLNYHVNQEFFEDAIKSYVAQRVVDLYSELETATDYATCARLQGSISEVKKLQNLRRDVNAVLTLHRK